jgi:hypothetical protein
MVDMAQFGLDCDFRPAKKSCTILALCSDGNGEKAQQSSCNLLQSNNCHIPRNFSPFARIDEIRIVLPRQSTSIVSSCHDKIQEKLSKKRKKIRSME